jgi:S1-C subfamily serine protease
MSVLEELSAATRRVSEKAAGAAVAIGRDRRGTGVVIGPGQVLTNAHNLRDRTTEVTFADGRSVQGVTAGIDADGDLAVLTVDTADAPAVEWADTMPGVGDAVFAVSAGQRARRVTFGLVSAVDRTFRGPRGRRVTGSIEHTAPLARGSSGGPLTDLEGRLLGLNTHRLGEGFYLAVPADATLKERVAKLAAGVSPDRRKLGVALAPAFVAARLRRSVGLPVQDGLLVRAVEDGSVADRAGLRQGDLLVAADGRQLSTADDLFEILDGDAVTINLTVVRGADELAVAITFLADAASEEGTV